MIFLVFPNTFEEAKAGIERKEGVCLAFGNDICKNSFSHIREKKKNDFCWN